MMTKKKLKKLKKEIKKLKQKNAELSALLEFSENAKLGKEDGYFAYLWKELRKNKFFIVFWRIGKIFSKFRLISLIFKIFGAIIIAVETSTVIFIWAVFLAIFLPPALIYFLSISLYALITFRRDVRCTVEAAAGKKIIFMFPSRKQKLSKNSFFYRNAQELVTHGYLIISVSPFFASSSDISGNKKIYANQKITEDGIITVRRQYFFRIKKKLLKDHRQRTIFIY